MTLILLGTAIALIVGAVGTRLYTGLAKRRGWAQFVRMDGPTTHLSKRGTPQMGGIAIMGATLTGYVLAHLVTWTPPSISGMLVLFLMLGVGFVGFLDDWTKIRQERSLGLRSWQKLAGQTTVAVVFALFATRFARDGITPASFKVSLVRDTAIDLAAFGVWKSLQNCRALVEPGCYQVRDPLDLALVAACLAGACIAFLWWNTPPAILFMGDTGSLALGGALAGLAIMTRTELLMVVLGGLFVFETVTVILQVGFFKLTKRRNGGVGRRLFLITPIHHHFEMRGWSQVTVSIRFWLISAICVGAGLALFYGEWVLRAG